MRISLERSILIVAEQFLLELIKKYGKNPVSTDSGSGSGSGSGSSSGSGSGTWYPQACRFLKLRHHTHSLTHSFILLRKKYHYRTNYSIHKKDGTEMFDDYFHVKKITVH